VPGTVVRNLCELICLIFTEALLGRNYFYSYITYEEIKEEID
jgi:hypothetical protein